MNIKEMNLAPVELASHTSKRNRGSLGRLARVCAVVTAVAVLPAHRVMADPDDEKQQIKTLRPTNKQLEDYSQKRRLRRAESSQLRCLMIFDTQIRRFVGSGCYVVPSEPSIGEVAPFETVSAEFVGQGNL